LATWTKGQILYSDDTNSLAQLDVGTNGHVLTVSSGEPAWAAPSSLTIALENLSDVSISSSASDDILTYDGNSQQWINHNAIKGILLSNLIDKTANETISGSWEFQGDISFNNGTVEIAGIENQNLLDKTANEIISGAWGFTGASSIVFSASDRTIGGIQVTNLLDKTANETISGSWEFQGDISFTGNCDLTGATLMGQFPIRFEGATDDENYINIQIEDPTAPRAILFQDHSGVAVINNTACYNLEGTNLSVTNGVLNAEIALENLSDVSISSSASDDILTYDGTNWINHNAIKGILLSNLIDKTAAETISGVWTHSAKIVPSAANIDFGANSSASAWEYGYFHNIRVDSIAIATGFAGSNLEILNPLHVQPTDSGASKEVLRFNRISASPTTADKDMIAFYYYNASFESTKYGEISFQYDDVTKDSENGAIILRVVNGGTMLDGIEIDKYGFQIHKGFTGTSGTADGSVRITSGTWKGTSTCLAISASEGSSSSAGFNTENLNYLMPVVYNGTEYQIPLYKP